MDYAPGTVSATVDLEGTLEILTQSDLLKLAPVNPMSGRIFQETDHQH